MIGLSDLTLKFFTRHNNIVKAYIELNKENLITYIKSQITIHACYDEKQRIESLIEYVSINYFLLLIS